MSAERRGVIRLAVLGVAVLTSASGARGPCLSPRGAAAVFAEIAARDWDRLDLATVRATWPDLWRTAPCIARPCEGIEDAGRALDECCSTCPICVSPGFWGGTEREEAPFWGLSAVSCRSGSPSALLGLERAVLPEGARPWWTRGDWAGTSAWPVPTRAYRWETPHGLRVLETRALRDDDRWVGHLDLKECTVEDPTETIASPDGRRVEVLQSERRPGLERIGEFWFRYASACHPDDIECLKGEMCPLWPLVKERAEAAGAHTVAFGAEACGLMSHDEFVDLDRPGPWADSFDCPT